MDNEFRDLQDLISSKSSEINKQIKALEGKKEYYNNLQIISNRLYHMSEILLRQEGENTDINTVIDDLEDIKDIVKALVSVTYVVKEV